jgi:pilus assembly protein Flp/PilA
VFERIRLMTLLLISDHEVERNDPRDDRGASAVEYGLLVALIAVVIAAIVTTVGTDLAAVFQNAANSFP